MKNSPLVSVLMNCYNGEKYLQEAINSILDQTYKNWELIFWDNKSTDKSAEIFLSNKDPRLYYYLSPTHTNLGNARIMASKKMKGDWFGIIDTDDLWEPNKLSKQINAIETTYLSQDPVGLVYCRAMGIDKNSLITKEMCHKEYLKTTMPKGRILDDLLFKGNFIVSPSILINKNIFLSVGGFPDAYFHASDYYISCAISSMANAICVEEYLVKYRMHDNNNTQKEKIISFEEQLKIFQTWKKYIKTSFNKKNKRVKELHTFAGLMMIKYNKQFIPGLFRIIRHGSLFFAIRNIFFELKKYLDN